MSAAGTVIRRERGSASTAMTTVAAAADPRQRVHMPVFPCLQLPAMAEMELTWSELEQRLALGAQAAAEGSVFLRAHRLSGSNEAEKKARAGALLQHYAGAHAAVADALYVALVLPHRCAAVVPASAALTRSTGGSGAAAPIVEWAVPGRDVVEWAAAGRALAVAAVSTRSAAAIEQQLRDGLAAHAAQFAARGAASLAHWTTWTRWTAAANNSIVLDPQLALALGQYPGQVLLRQRLFTDVWPWALERARLDVGQWAVTHAPTLEAAVARDAAAARAVALGREFAQRLDTSSSGGCCAWLPGISLVSPVVVVAAVLSGLRRDTQQRPGGWQPPQTNAERRRRHGKIRGGLKQLEDLLVDHVRLCVPPCLRQLLQSARETRHLYHDDRRTVAGWLVAIQPLPPSIGDGGDDSDRALAAFVLSPSAKANALDDLAAAIRTQRQKRAASAEHKTWSCAGIIAATLAPRPSGKPALATQCPFVRDAGGSDKLTCLRKCCGGRDTLVHPLDHILRALEW